MPARLKLARSTPVIPLGPGRHRDDDRCATVFTSGISALRAEHVEPVSGTTRLADPVVVTPLTV